MLEKRIITSNPYVKDKFLEESRRWKKIFLEEFRNTNKNYPYLKLHKSKNISRIQISPPLVREGKDRNEGEFHYKDNYSKIISHGGFNGVGKYQIIPIFTGSLVKYEFSLAYESMQGLKKPIIIRIGDQIKNYSNNKYQEYINYINHLGDKHRHELKTDFQISKFLKEYLHTTNELIYEINI